MSRMVKILFSIATAKPSFAVMRISKNSFVISNSSPSNVITVFPSASTLAMKAAGSSLPSAAAKTLILLPNTGPAVLKFGFREKFIYWSRFCSKTTFLTFSSSMISGTRSPISASYLPSTSTSESGCLTLILSFSRVPRPSPTKALTISIRSSTPLSTSDISAFGKNAT